MNFRQTYNIHHLNWFLLLLTIFYLNKCQIDKVYFVISYLQIQMLIILFVKYPADDNDDVCDITLINGYPFQSLMIDLTHFVSLQTIYKRYTWSIPRKFYSRGKKGKAKDPLMICTVTWPLASNFQTKSSFKFLKIHHKYSQNEGWHRADYNL